MTMTIHNTQSRVRKQPPLMELLSIEQRRKMVEQIHSKRYEIYRDTVAAHLPMAKRDGYAIVKLMRDRKSGINAGRIISETIGENHDEYIMKLVDLGEPIEFINY